ncbi:MAG: ThuA domain-containing protein [Spirochaetales bacterium]|nr:ThuA domain-containing protein [Spirochaetales bacterium]MCF7939246.1 ThuA domain-containing protein [Spirochaetales bacterium]
MAKKQALIVYGGWDGHEPDKVAAVFKQMLEENDFDVEMADTLDAYNDKDKLKRLDLIVPHWTMGELSVEQADAVLEAVAGGVGIAGCHAGLCDAFRGSPDWQFMAGGQLVAHVGAAGLEGNGINFEVKIKNKKDPIVSGLKDFSAYDEQYYLHTDPALNVLATTMVPPVKGEFESDGTANMNFDFGFGDWNFKEKNALSGPHADNKPVEMPVVWTKYWGKGRVFYNSLGHDEARVKMEPALTITKRGFLWAAK